MEDAAVGGLGVTYYDEFNLTPAASAEEIRKAHRTLSRILHPDHQTDEPLRRLAEIQMRRINEIYASLSDSERRRRYDESIETRPQAPDRARSSPLPLRAWTAAGACAGLAVLWLAFASMRSGCPAPSLPSPAEPALSARAAAVPPAASRIARRRPPGPSNPPSRMASLFPAPSLLPTEDRPASDPGRPDDPPRQPAPPLVSAQANPVRDAALPPVPFSAAAEPAAEAPSRSLAGTWYYPRQPVQEPSALYPPEFIELAIVEAHGALHGRYRARYRVSNRALSPDVAFRFDGKAADNDAGLAWRSSGGARGEVRLRLISEGKLEVAWSASVLGELGLSAGTAVLVRKR